MDVKKNGGPKGRRDGVFYEGGWGIKSANTQSSVKIWAGGEGPWEKGSWVRASHRAIKWSEKAKTWGGRGGAI